MIEVCDKVYNYTFPEECSVGTVVSRESETAFIIEWMHRETGELYKRTTLDYNIYKNNLVWRNEIGILRLFYREEGWLHEVLWNTD